ncbi:MAG: hypothetical protein Q8Q06_02355 [bacterium]|nr:hypothetical protein [bacterium]
MTRKTFLVAIISAPVIAIKSLMAQPFSINNSRKIGSVSYISNEDFIGKYYKELGYPPKGMLRIICGDMVSWLMVWVKGDYGNLENAKKAADECCCFDTSGSMYWASVYDHKGRRIYQGANRRKANRRNTSLA